MTKCKIVIEDDGEDVAEASFDLDVLVEMPTKREVGEVLCAAFL